MIRFSPRVGLVFREGLGTCWRLMRRAVTGKIIFENSDGATLALTPAELLERWEDQRWTVHEDSLGKAGRAILHSVAPDLRCLSEREQVQVKRRLRYVLAIERSFRQAGGSFISTVNVLRSHIDSAAERLKDPSPPSPATAWRWWSTFSPTRSPMKLRDRRGRNAPKSDIQAFGVFEESVNEIFLNEQKYPAKRVYSRLKEKISRINAYASEDQHIRLPAKATVYRWINRLYYAVVRKAREGKAVTEKELRVAKDHVKVQHVLERVEIDHSPLDVQIIDKASGLVLGRAWLTLAIDRRSRCVLGFFLGFNPPSGYSVLACLRRAILPKTAILRRFPQIRSDWPCHGVMDLIACDNGMDLHANDVEAAALAMSIEVLFCGVEHPEMKGAVERIFRTLSEDLIHQLPGTTFSNPRKRGKYNSEAKAAIDLETATLLITKWIVDWYHNRPHRSLQGKTPLEVWTELARDRVIELPANPRDLDVIASHSSRATLFHYGVQVDNLFYNSDVLRDIRWELGGTPVLAVRYREEDVGSVYVQDPRSQEFVEVPCTQTEYAKGLNRCVHRLVVAQARQRSKDGWTQLDLLQIRQEIQGIVDNAVKAKKTIDRKRAARALMQDSESVFESEEVAAEDQVHMSAPSVGVDACDIDIYQPVELDMEEMTA